jgi:hypothetical protein
MMPMSVFIRIGTFANCAVLSQHRDDTGLANALPWKAQHERVKLRAGKRQCASGRTRAGDAALRLCWFSDPAVPASLRDHVHHGALALLGQRKRPAIPFLNPAV